MSGVVSEEFCSSFLIEASQVTPRVPIEADFLPKNSKICRVNSAVEVFPLVPVIA